MTNPTGRYRTKDREIVLIFPDLYSRAITRRRSALCDFLARALPLFDLAERDIRRADSRPLDLHMQD